MRASGSGSDNGSGPESHGPGRVLAGRDHGARGLLLGGAAALAGRVVALAGRYAQLPQTDPVDTTLFLSTARQTASCPTASPSKAPGTWPPSGADVVADLLPSVGHEIDSAMLELVVRRLKTHVPKRHWEAALRQGVPPAGGGMQ